MILVTGAGGKTGRAVVKALVAKGAAVRAFVHREQHVAALSALGASEIIVGSFEDALALGQATNGVRAVYHICPNVSPSEVAIGRSVVRAAVAFDVERFVFHSVLHPQIEAMPHHVAKLRVEEMVLESRLDATILQPTAYMQNILTGWRSIVEQGVFRVPYPVETRLSLVDLADIAEVAATVLTQPGYGGATYELAGSIPLSQTEVASTLGMALGRKVRAQAQTVEAWQAQATGLDEHARNTLARMLRHYARHGLMGNPNVLRWLLGRTPTTLAAFVARVESEGSAS